MAINIVLKSCADMLAVAKMLGHAAPATTLNTYGHAAEEAKRKAAESNKAIHPCR